MMKFLPTAEYAQHLDAVDPLAVWRERFYIPKGQDGAECIYLCGNSLGLQPKATRDYLDRELERWARLGVEGYWQGDDPWLTYAAALAPPLARLVGARPLEVVAMNTLSVNLHLMLATFYRPDKSRYKIIMDAAEFPSDRYAAVSHIKWHGFDPEKALVEVAPQPGEAIIHAEDIEEALRMHGASTAVLLFSGVNYLNGQAHDIAQITEIAHRYGCMAGFDLAHAIGNIPLHLHNWDVDFAVWCSYKYLNAGPGGTAGCFVHEKYANAVDLPRLAGWWGHDEATRFQMPHEFVPMPGAAGWQISHSAVLPLAALRASLDMFQEIGLPAIREKSERLTGYLEFLLQEKGGDGFSIITPSEKLRRGAQLSLRVPGKAEQIYKRLLAANIICDWRAPDVIRVAPAPLYNRFMDVYRFVEVFCRTLDLLRA